MKRIFFFILAAIALSSCSYKSKVVLKDTDLHFEIVELNGNHAIVRTTPDDDYVLYVANMMEAAEFERMMGSMSEVEFQKKVLDEFHNHYDEWRKNWTGRTDKYVADFYEHECYASPIEGYFLNLKPLTRYCVFGFCVNPDSSEPLGPVQKLEFSTPEYKPVGTGIDFDFMIRDTREAFYYYVRPSKGGKICFDTYFSTVFKNSDYEAEPYKGDIRAYLKKWMDDMGENLDLFLSLDISRYQTILEMEDGEYYTIVGCPYLNLGKSPLTVRYFKYEEGMSTSYGHDEVIE